MLDKIKKKKICFDAHNCKVTEKMFGKHFQFC